MPYPRTHYPLVTSTDPTYKEWKPLTIYHHIKIGLRTDPTYKEWKRFSGGIGPNSHYWHGSYLQGMETRGCDGAVSIRARTDPTYKEWKRYSTPDPRQLLL